MIDPGLNLGVSSSRKPKEPTPLRAAPPTTMNERMKQIPQSSWDRETKYLVLIGYYDFDVSWVEKLKLPHIIYYKDMPDKAPYTAINKAKGETNILKFIIDFYDELPQNIINVHQYEHKWYHTGSLVDILNNLDELESRYTRSPTKGFMSINDTLKAILGHKGVECNKMNVCGYWDVTMAPYFGSYNDCGNFTGTKSGCSQFIVSRDRILSLPRVFYKNMYDWFVNNVVDEPSSSYNPVTFRRIKTPGFDHPLSNHMTSRYLEWTWELIFTTVKKTEISQLKQTYSLNYLDVSRHVLALYGKGGNLRDVTGTFLDNWVYPIGLKQKDTKYILNCPPGKFLPFLCGNHIVGATKRLQLFIDDKIYEISDKDTGSLIIEL